MILIRIYASDSLGTAKSDVDKDSSVKQIYFFHSVSFMPGGGGGGGTAIYGLYRYVPR